MSSKRLPDDSMTPLALFLEGAKLCLPILVSLLPFGLLFGALAVKSGMSVAEAVLMSLTIFAGASQLVGIELFGQQIPAWMIILSIFAVNFRHILYSAAVGRHIARWSPWRQVLAFFVLVDPVFAESERRSDRGESVQFAWYMGLALPAYIVWASLTWVGALFGNLLENPERWGVDFILPIYFMALVLGFRKRAFWLPVVAVSAGASILAMQTVGSPWHVSIGALAGILVAALFSPTARGNGKAADADLPSQEATPS